MFHFLQRFPICCFIYILLLANLEDWSDKKFKNWLFDAIYSWIILNAQLAEIERSKVKKISEIIHQILSTLHLTISDNLKKATECANIKKKMKLWVGTINGRLTILLGASGIQ